MNGVDRAPVKVKCGSTAHRGAHRPTIAWVSPEPHPPQERVGVHSIGPTSSTGASAVPERGDVRPYDGRTVRVEWNDGDRLLARCSCGALWGVAASVLPGYLNYAAAGRRALVLEPDRPGVQLFKSGRPG